MLWGSAYPAIKNGYELFAIATDDIAGKMVFAGYRFLLAGLVLLIMGRLGGRRIVGLGRRRIGQLTLLGLTQTGLQYIFFYVGLSYTRSEEHTSELQSLMRISYAVFCLKKQKII